MHCLLVPVDLLFFLQHYYLFPSIEDTGSGESSPAHFLTTGDEYARLVVDSITDAAPAKSGQGKRDLGRYDFTG